MTEQTLTSGVQDLIDRLSQEGVAEGERQAHQIVADANHRADSIVRSARAEAEEIRRSAQQDADKFRSSSEEALKVACRDAVRDFASRIHDGFRQLLQELVQHQLGDDQTLKQMILEISRQAAPPEDATVELLLPRTAIKEEEVRQRILSGDHDALTQFVRGLLGEDIREGFTVGFGRDTQHGLCVRVVDQQVEIDLTEEAITELLARHLMPRFRAVMRGD